MTSGRSRVIVVGCGNPFGRDDAVGVEVSAKLRKVSGHSCEVLEMQQFSLGFLDEVPSDATVIFVDAVRSGARPGTIHAVRLPSEKLKSRTLESISTHGFDLRKETALQMNLGHTLPEMYLIGIEIENWSPGIGLTRRVHTAAMKVVRELAKYDATRSTKLPFFTHHTGKKSEAEQFLKRNDCSENVEGIDEFSSKRLRKEG